MDVGETGGGRRAGTAGPCFGVVASSSVVGVPGVPLGVVGATGGGVIGGRVATEPICGPLKI